VLRLAAEIKRWMRQQVFEMNAALETARTDGAT
jgi:hypothetical protein